MILNELNNEKTLVFTGTGCWLYLLYEVRYVSRLAYLVKPVSAFVCFTCDNTSWVTYWKAAYPFALFLPDLLYLSSYLKVFFRCFLAKCNCTFLFSSLISGLHLFTFISWAAVGLNMMYLHPLDLGRWCKVVFLNQRKNHWSSLVVFDGLSGSLVLLSWLVHFFYVWDSWSGHT